MILLWGLPDDSPIRSVRTALEECGEAPLMLDQFETARCNIHFDETDPAGGVLTIGDRSIPLAAITAVYLRPYDSGRVLRAAGVSDAMATEHVHRFDDALLLWTELTPALVVNRPSAMASNNSKPLQSAFIAESGFEVPATLLTSDPEEAAAFLARHRRAIYKSIGGVRSRVSPLDEKVIERLVDAACPLQIQEHIDGCDFRVHVLGRCVFACRIESAASDYRYPAGAEQAPAIHAVDLPVEVTDRCIQLTRTLGLAFSGIDLRHSQDGRWVCFEANPSPGYTFYEQETGAPITQALVSLLRGSASKE